MSRRQAVLLALVASLAPSAVAAQTVWRSATLEEVHTRVQVPGRFVVATRSGVMPQGYLLDTTYAAHSAAGRTFVVVVVGTRGGNVTRPDGVAEMVSAPLLRPWPTVEVRDPAWRRTWP